MIEEAEGAGNYDGETDAVDGGGNESQESSHASADNAHMHDMSPGGASPGESETTPALDADTTVPSGPSKATKTNSDKKRRRGGRRKKKTTEAGVHTRFPSDDEEDSTSAVLPTSVSVSEATSRTLLPQSEAKDDPKAKPFLEGRRIYARDGSVKQIHGTDHCVYRPDGSRMPGMLWTEETAAKSIRSEQGPR